MINRLTINQDTKPWQFTKEEAILAAKGGYYLSKVETASLACAQIDQNDTYDLDPEQGKVYTKTQFGKEVSEYRVSFNPEYGHVVGPSDIDEYSSEKTHTGTGARKTERMQNEALCDINGDCQPEEGTLITVSDYKDSFSPASYTLKIFANMGDKSLTIIEERPDPTPENPPQEPRQNP